MKIFKMSRAEMGIFGGKFKKKSTKFFRNSRKKIEKIKILILGGFFCFEKFSDFIENSRNERKSRHEQPSRDRNRRELENLCQHRNAHDEDLQNNSKSHRANEIKIRKSLTRNHAFVFRTNRKCEK